MYDKDYRDLIGGLLVMLVGVFVAWYAATTYALGTLHRVGPGMFPAGAGVILALLGLSVMLPALVRQGPRMAVAPRPMLAALASILVFGLLVQRAGLVPAIFGLVLTASLAERPRPVRSLLLAAGLCIASVLIFKLGLGLQVPIARWPL